jgi:cytidylate kinase
MLERLALSTVVAEGGLPAPPANPALMMMSSSDYRQLIEQVIRQLAKEGGCVIVGHAGQAILEQTPQVFKVLVHGSQQRRVERLVKEEKIDEKEAMHRVKDWDHQRIEFFKHVYNLDWLGSATYDMTINTDEVDYDTAISLIMTGVEAVK